MLQIKMTPLRWLLAARPQRWRGRTRDAGALLAAAAAAAVVRARCTLRFSRERFGSLWISLAAAAAAVAAAARQIKFHAGSSTLCPALCHNSAQLLPLVNWRRINKPLLWSSQQQFRLFAWMGEGEINSQQFYCFISRLLQWTGRILNGASSRLLMYSTSADARS